MVNIALFKKHYPRGGRPDCGRALFDVETGFFVELCGVS